MVVSCWQGAPCAWSLPIWAVRPTCELMSSTLPSMLRSLKVAGATRGRGSGSEKWRAIVQGKRSVSAGRLEPLTVPSRRGDLRAGKYSRLEARGRAPPNALNPDTCTGIDLSELSNFIDTKIPL